MNEQVTCKPLDETEKKGRCPARDGQQMRLSQRIAETVLPLIAIASNILYSTCGTGCSALKGTLFGFDLIYIGSAFMVAYLCLTILDRSRIADEYEGLKPILQKLITMMICGALGGEMILIRFQVVENTFCPFCLFFAACVFSLFVIRLKQLEKYSAVAGFMAGVLTFAIFFQGRVVPLY